MQVEYGGDPFAKFELPESELLGIIAAVIILILAFGSVLAMGLPIGIALFGLGIASALVGSLSHVIAMPDFTISMVAMIGLGVGIDYALFIVTRYREGLKLGLSVEDERRRGDRHERAGGAVRRHTVIIALLGLSLMGLELRPVDRHRLVDRRADDGARLADAAAGVARLGRSAHREHHARRHDRRHHRRRRGDRRILIAGAAAAFIAGFVPAIGFFAASFVPTSSGRCASSSRTVPSAPRSRASGTGGAARSSAGRGRSPSAPPVCCSCWRSRCSRSGSASATPATTPRTRPCAGPTTCSPRASDRATTAAADRTSRATPPPTSRP